MVSWLLLVFKLNEKTKKRVVIKRENTRQTVKSQIRMLERRGLCVCVWRWREKCMWHSSVWETGCSRQPLLLWGLRLLMCSSRLLPLTLRPECSPPLLSSPKVSLRHKSKRKTRGGKLSPWTSHHFVTLCDLYCNLDPLWACVRSGRAISVCRGFLRRRSVAFASVLYFSSSV